MPAIFFVNSAINLLKLIRMTKLYFLGCFLLPLLIINFFLPSTSNNWKPPSQQDSLAADRAKYVQLVMEKIAGKENDPSDAVFKDVKLLKMPAGRFLKVMEMGFSKSLGVSCGHCHNTNDFSSSEKPGKDIARQMFIMTGKINNDLLKNISNLENKNPVIN